MKIFENYDLTNHNSYRLKSRCRIAYFPETKEDIIDLYRTIRDTIIILGEGYNVILSKEYYDESFVIFKGNFNKIEFLEDGIVKCEAGQNLYNLSLEALNLSMSGLEIFYDIPSSLGGAIVMNAGANGIDIQSILKKVEYFDPQDLLIKEICTGDIQFEYRNSFFQRNPHLIVTSAWLQLVKGDYNEIRSKMESYKQSRWSKQPREFPNAGSVFKRPKGYFVGTMLEELKLKGLTVGGARISTKHAGFIENYNDAKASDIIDLIEIVKDRVYSVFKIVLEVEQRII